MDFRLNRLILIDSYCRNRIVEIDLRGHITINGENGAGKTTLLRLLPMFFGEKPSNIIRGDAVVERFSKYYFPTTASYIVFEYQRRNQTAMAVIHVDGQKDGVVYRLIDSEYKPELFMSGNEVIQSNKLHTHLEKLNVFDSKPLTLHTYKQIMQNTAGRDHKRLMSLFSFTGGSGRLTHMERIVTGILQRATTFYDLKRMIVSSILDGDEGFSLRTSKKELMQWVREYEAHYAVMDKASLMQELENIDYQRKTIESDFSKLHGKLHLIHEHHDKQVALAESDEQAAKDNKSSTETDYADKLRDLVYKKTQFESKANQLKSDLNGIIARRKTYDQDNAEGKSAKVDSLSGLIAQQNPLKVRIQELEGAVSSISEIFSSMERDASDYASNHKSDIAQKRINAYKQNTKKKDDLSVNYTKNRQDVGIRHETERETADNKVNKLRIDERGLIEALNNVQADSESLEALSKSQQVERESNQKLQNLHDKTSSLQKSFDRLKNDFEELEEQINSGEVAVENAEIELEKLLAANNAGEDTLLGFLRLHKPDWVTSIGRIVPEDILLRKDISPSLASGSDLYGVNIDLEKLTAGRFASEDELQREIKSVKNRLDRKNAEVGEDRLLLAKKLQELNSAKESLSIHESDLSIAKTAVANAKSNVTVAENRVAGSKKTLSLSIQENLNRCRDELKTAEASLTAIKIAHQKELSNADESYRQAVSGAELELKETLSLIAQEEQAIEKELADKLVQIASDRDESLRNKGVSTDVLNGIRDNITKLQSAIDEASGLSSYVLQYRTWVKDYWSKKQSQEIEFQSAYAEFERLSRQNEDLLKERHRVLKEKDDLIDQESKKVEVHIRSRAHAKSQMSLLAIWPIDQEIVSSSMDHLWTVESLGNERIRLQKLLDDCRESIRVGVEDIRRQMCKDIGTGPERFYSTALNELGYRPGREYEWIEVFRTWYNDRHAENRNSLLQMGKTMAQNISHFWKTLSSFKRDVSTFSSDLKANLDQGRIFDSIADVSVDIRAEVDTQNYWNEVQELHQEYDAWHSLGDSTLPPQSFVAAAKRVAVVVSDEKGLVADPVDLISLKISANVNNQGVRTANNEHELTNMSSNGLSYIILCVILIGFVNRIRRKESVTVPFVVDELKDLSYLNAKTLLELLSRNNITMVSAFPDIDLDLAELFAKNYKILPGREIGLIELDSLDADMADEVAYV